MKELAAFCERYQREVPGARDEISKILDKLQERADQGEPGRQSDEVRS